MNSNGSNSEYVDSGEYNSPYEDEDVAGLVRKVQNNKFMITRGIYARFFHIKGHSLGILMMWGGASGDM